MKRKWQMMLLLMSLLLLLVACSQKEKEKPTKETEPEVTIGKIQEVDTTALKEQLAMYENVNVALEEGYEPVGTYIPGKGYRFIHQTKPYTEPLQPNGLLYGLGEDGNFVLIGAEWVALGEGVYLPEVYEGVRWNQLNPAGGYYDDGTFLEVPTENDATQTNEETGATLVAWLPSLHTISFFLVDTEEGLFANESEEVRRMYDEKGMQQPLASIRYIESLND